MLIKWVPDGNLVYGHAGNKIQVGSVFNYIDLKGESVKLQLEYLCYGGLYNLPGGVSLIQFSIVK